MFRKNNWNIGHIDKAIIELKTENGNILGIEVLIVPSIAAQLSKTAHFEVSNYYTYVFETCPSRVSRPKNQIEST